MSRVRVHSGLEINKTTDEFAHHRGLMAFAIQSRDRQAVGCPRQTRKPKGTLTVVGLKSCLMSISVASSSLDHVKTVGIKHLFTGISDCGSVLHLFCYSN